MNGSTEDDPALTCESWSWNFHDFSGLRGACDVEENVVIAGVHVRGLEGGASQQHRLSLRHLQQHVGDQEGGTVILGQNLNGELVSGLMLAVTDA